MIGIDQSYTRTGISIAADNKLLKVSSLAYKDCKTKTDKRKALAELLKIILNKLQGKSEKIIIMCERVRTFSGREKQFISTDYIKATGALIAVIVDTAAEYGIPVYSVATNSWKAQIVGKARAEDGKDKKRETLDFINKLGFNVNDDAADSACIALYWFLPDKKKKIKLEL